MDEPERWKKKVKDPEGEHVIDLIETLPEDLDLR